MSTTETIQTFLTDLDKRPSFRQVDLKPLLKEQWADANVNEQVLTDEQKAALPEQALVWIDGIFQPELSQASLSLNRVAIEVNSVHTVTNNNEWAQLTSGDQEHVHLTIDQQAEIENPIELVFVATNQQLPTLHKHKLSIRLESGAQCQFVFKIVKLGDEQPSWLHQDISWHLNRDAICNWHQYCSENAKLYVTQIMSSQLERGAQLKQFSASAKQAYLYHYNLVELLGDHSSYEGYGFYRAFDKDSVHYRVYVIHEGKDTKSNQFFRGI